MGTSRLGAVGVHWLRSYDDCSSRRSLWGATRLFGADLAVLRTRGSFPVDVVLMRAHARRRPQIHDRRTKQARGDQPGTCRSRIHDGDGGDRGIGCSAGHEPRRFGMAEE
jgi:hypothetical protein